MERNAQQWRRTITNSVLRPLVQQHHRNAAAAGAGGPHQQQAALPDQSSQPSLQHHQLATNSATAAANRMLHQWIPLRQPATGVLSQPPANASAAGGGGGGDSGNSASSVVINLDGSSSSSTGNSGASPSVEFSQRTVGVAGGPPTDEATTPTSSATAATSPTQSMFDARRAQILRGLQNDPPHLDDDAQPSPTQPNAADPGGADGAAAGGGGGPNHQTAAAGSDLFAQIPEARQLIDALTRYVPFVVILVFKFMIDHVDGILNVVLLLAMFAHADWQVKKQIGRQKQRSCFALWREMAYVTLVLLFVVLMLGEWSWYQWWFSRRAEQNTGAGAGEFSYQRLRGSDGDVGGGGDDSGGDSWSLRRLLYVVLVTDLVAKLATVHAKIAVTLLPPCVINYRNRVSADCR